ncbi:MAG TPA: hypothetical protein VNO30_01995 [Kofleriaceae bacterium]|nr:hypothetical protein [Kofleriaceae bacterium]
MSFDPWNGRTTVQLGSQPGGQSLGDAPLSTAPIGTRPVTPAMPVYATIRGPKKAKPGELHWVVQWKPAGAAPAAGWTVHYAAAQTAPAAPAAPAASTASTAQPAQPAPPAPPAAAPARPTLGGSARSISRHLTATWSATASGKPTTIAT